MQDNEAGDASEAKILASIRDMDAEERAGRGGSDRTGTLQLTASMRLDGPKGLGEVSGPAYRRLPTGPLGPAPDEEPPLLLTRRLDQGPALPPVPEAEPEPADFEPAPAWSSRGAAPTDEPEAAPEPAASPTWPTAPASEAAAPVLAAPWPSSDPKTFSAAEPSAPSFPAPAPAGPEPDLPPEPAAAAPRLEPVPAFAPEPGLSPRAGVAMPSSQALRRAMSVDETTGAPPPFPAAGLPRSRDELTAMIRQAIRDELAGPLGERISVNIRQLVAREVRRAVEELDAEQRKGPGAS